MLPICFVSCHTDQRVITCRFSFKMVFRFNGLFPEVKQVIRTTRINVLISFHIVQLRFYQKIDHMLIQSSMLFASTHGKIWTKC